MAKINIDRHVLKKIGLLQAQLDSTMRKADVLLSAMAVISGEIRTLLEFIEEECKMSEAKNGGLDNKQT